MTSSRILLLLLLFGLMTGCGGGGGGGSDSGPSPAPAPQANNVVLLTVNGSLCSRNYLNKACVSVTICTPGTSNCQTIDDIVLDTASFGLRVFAQALTVPLTQVSLNAGDLAECVQFGDQSTEWGPVQMASVILGNEPAVQAPIQVIDATFATRPAQCAGAEASPDTAGFNGILGVGVFKQDCGAGCANSSNGLVPPWYYLCSGGACNPTAVPLSSQVQNPVALLPNDNNGVIVQLPAVPASGAPSVDGQLVLGIGTQANNAPGAVTTFGTDLVGNIRASFNGSTIRAFFDTGSNGLFFPRTNTNQLPNCASTSSWFCPASTVGLTADNKGASGSPTGTVSFQIGNFEGLTGTSNRVFPDIGGNHVGSFDWGLPFHMGRNVYVGIEGTKSSLGTGPYFAY